MKPADAALAVLTSVIWGLAFVATRIALDSFSPPQLTALRFLIACLPVLSGASSSSSASLCSLGSSSSCFSPSTTDCHRGSPQ